MSSMMSKQILLSQLSTICQGAIAVYEAFGFFLKNVDIYYVMAKHD